MPDVAEAEPDPRRWLSLLTCCSALFMTLLDVSVTNVALPSIGAATGAAPSQLQWVVSGYTLAFGLVPVLAGRLGDDHGRRLMFQVGVGSFTATSILAGLSPSVGCADRGAGAAGAGRRSDQPAGFGLGAAAVSRHRAWPGFRRAGNDGRRRYRVGAFDRRWPHRARRTARGLAAGVLHQCPGRRGGDCARPAAASADPALGRHHLDTLGAALLGTATFCVLFGFVAVRRGAGPPPGLAGVFPRWSCSRCSSGGNAGSPGCSRIR